MTQTTLNQKLHQLEDEMSNATEAEKAQITERIQALLTSQKSNDKTEIEEGEDLFDNMPV